MGGPQCRSNHPVLPGSQCGRTNFRSHDYGRATDAIGPARLKFPPLVTAESLGEEIASEEAIALSGHTVSRIYLRSTPPQ